MKEPFDLDVFHPEDAQGVAALFQSVYGDGYPIKTVYNPSQLIEAFEKKENMPVVARTSSGRVIAYEALYRSAPNPDVYEAGQGLVALDYRGKGVNSRINDYLMNVLLPGLSIDAVFGEAVCNQIYMQKNWRKFQAIETAIEIDLMPHEAYKAETSAAGRVATVCGFRIYRDGAQTVHLPAPYTNQLEWIYSEIEEERNFKTGNAIVPSGPSRIDLQVFDSAQAARMTLWEAGADDLETSLSFYETNLRDRGVIVFQIWLNLSWPFVDAVVEVLRRRHYFFGGLLPKWFGTDGLLMQKVTQKPNWEGIHLYTDRAGRILKFIREDWERSGHDCGAA